MSKKPQHKRQTTQARTKPGQSKKRLKLGVFKPSQTFEKALEAVAATGKKTMH